MGGVWIALRASVLFPVFVTPRFTDIVAKPLFTGRIQMA
jgi:hypothetical protein